MPIQFSWVLYPHHEYLTHLWDEFVIGQFRLLVRGNSLQLNMEGFGKEDLEHEAHELARRYSHLLTKHLVIHVQVITKEDFAGMPAAPQMITVRAAKQEDYERAHEAMRKARNELLKSEDLTLRRCYDYMQDARKLDQNLLSNLYKTVEAIQKQLGREKEAVQALSIRTELKFVKRLANDSKRDERHPPLSQDNVHRPEREEKLLALDYVNRIVRRYEEFLSRRRL